jgi:hypothetical protein
MVEWSKALLNYTAWTQESLGQMLLGACFYVQGTAGGGGGGTNDAKAQGGRVQEAAWGIFLIKKTYFLFRYNVKLLSRR